jgi:hypothetical protein
MNGNSESVQALGLDRARQCERKIKDTTTITLEESNIPDATKLEHVCKQATTNNPNLPFDP